MIKGSRNCNLYGIEGYNIPKTCVTLERPRSFLISKSKNNHYLTTLMEEKKMIPAPGQYELAGNLLMKKKI